MGLECGEIFKKYIWPRTGQEHIHHPGDTAEKPLADGAYATATLRKKVMCASWPSLHVEREVAEECFLVNFARKYTF